MPSAVAARRSVRNKFPSEGFRYGRLEKESKVELLESVACTPWQVLHETLPPSSFMADVGFDGLAFTGAALKAVGFAEAFC